MVTENYQGLPSISELSIEDRKALIKELPIGVVQRSVIIGLQHIFKTTGALFNDLINQVKFNPKDVFLIGKLYSTDWEAVNMFRKSKIYYVPFVDDKYNVNLKYADRIKSHIDTLWTKVGYHCLKQNSDKKYLIVLDEGGHLMENIPQYILNSDLKIIGIEQTTHGIRKAEKYPTRVPIISVATAAAKKYLEADTISETIIDRLNTIINKSKFIKPNIGLIGLGVIGRSFIKIISKTSFKDKIGRINIYDKDHATLNKIKQSFPDCFQQDSIKSLIKASDIILGCTGKDISAPNWMDIETDCCKLLISCSSSDIEFQSLIYNIDLFRENPKTIFEDIKLVRNGVEKFKILFGGYPINFKKRENGPDNRDPEDKIEITRLLLFQGVRFAVHILGNYDLSNIKPDAQIIQLAPWYQIYAAKVWFSKYDNMRNEIDKYEKITYHFDATHQKTSNWVNQNSGGEILNKVLSPAPNKQISMSKIY